MSRPRRDRDGTQPVTALMPARSGLLVPAPDADAFAALVPRFLLWFQYVRERAPASIAGYGADLSTFVAFCARGGLRHPDQVKVQHIELFMAWLRQDRGLKATSVNRARHALSTFWRWLIREELAIRNPVDSTAPLKTPARLPGYLTIAEQERVLATLAKDTTLAGRRDYALVMTALACGLRCEELSTLKVEHVSIEAGVLRVVGKGDKEREGIIVPRLRAVLGPYLDEVRPKLLGWSPYGRLGKRRLGPPSPRRGRERRTTWVIEYTRPGGEWRHEDTGTNDEAEARRFLADRLAELRVLETSPYLFLRTTKTGYAGRRKGLPLERRAIFAMVRRRLTAIVGRPVHPHMLRHSFASRLWEHGAGIELIQVAMGHSDIKTTTIYMHLSTKKRRHDVAKFWEGTA